MQNLIVTTGNDVAGRGIVVRATGIGRGIVGGLKSIAGGNISEFAYVCEKARQDASNLMITHAREIGASAVISFR